MAKLGCTYQRTPQEATPGTRAGASLTTSLLDKTAPDGTRQWMHSHVDDEVAFQSRLDVLAQSIAAGPDQAG
jgi:hypothetical protein